MTCLFIFLIVKWRTSHKYIFVKSLFISLEKIHVATAEHSTTCVFSSLSTSTHNICWWLAQSSYKLCNKQIWASSVSAIVYEKISLINIEIWCGKNFLTLKTWWNFAMAAKLCEKLLEPKFSNVWTNTSIFSGLYVISTISLSLSGFGRSFKMFNTSSAEHFWRMAWTSWCAVVVPGNEAEIIQ